MIAHHGLKLRALFLQFKPVIDRTAFLLNCFAVACFISVLLGFIKDYGQNAWETFVFFNGTANLFLAVFPSIYLFAGTVLLYFVVALFSWRLPSRIFWQRSFYGMWLFSSLLLLLLLLRDIKYTLS